MSLARIKQSPLRFADGGKRDVRTQFGALCWRMKNGKVEVLLVTSRRRKRWIIPKGWPVDGAKPVDAAETEAWEEAGVNGKAHSVCLGIYSYLKEFDEGDRLPCVVAVFPIKVKKVAREWPEMGSRRRKWLSQKAAAKVVDDRELGEIILNFDPSLLKH